MKPIQISQRIHVRVESVWNAYTSEEDIKQWNHASDDWHCTSASNDLRIGGKLKYRMASKDGGHAFDFEGTYSRLDPFRQIDYTMPNGRKVEIHFKSLPDATDVTLFIDPETERPVEQQKEGWNAILTNFRTYVEKIYSL